MKTLDETGQKIGNAAFLFHWADAVKQEERSLRVWMHSSPETSRIMDHIDHVDVLPSLVVPLLKACKERYLSGDHIPESQLRSMIHDLHDCVMLPSLVSIIPSDWDSKRINMNELVVIASTLENHYPSIRDELNGENWKMNSLVMIKAVCALEVSARLREQESHRFSGGQGFIRPEVGHLYFSEDMARFIIDNPQHCEDIVHIVLTRKTRDFDLISSIINLDAKALSEGAL